MLENKVFMKEEIRIEEREHAGVSAMNQKRFLEVLKEQIEMCSREKIMRLRTSERESVLQRGDLVDRVF